MAVLSLYSRPKVMGDCLKALFEKIDGKISQAELEARMREVERKQLPLFDPKIGMTPNKEITS